MLHYISIKVYKYVASTGSDLGFCHLLARLDLSPHPWMYKVGKFRCFHKGTWKL